MFRTTFVLTCFLLLAGNVPAQTPKYSYMTDKMFLSPQDLIGYHFVPSQMEIPNEVSTELAPDEYSFGITRNNLYVDGQNIKGLYNINNINSTEYGFKLLLINARNPSEQGHLKVILIGPGYVDALVFRKSQDAPETIFFLPELPDAIAQGDAAYYTDRKELFVAEKDSIWGTRVYPFFRVYTSGSIYEKLYAEDSTWVQFVEEVEVIEKGRKKKTKNAAEEGDMSETNDTTLPPSDTEKMSDDEETQKTPTVKTKIEKSYYIDVKYMLRNEDGTTSPKQERYTVKNVKIYEDEGASDNQERYQWVFDTNKGTIELYLDGEKTVSSIQLFDERYLVRGH